jgi:hypothetical protein
MAVHLGINRGHLSDLEEGKRELGLLMLQVIAGGLDTTMATLLRVCSSQTWPLMDSISYGLNGLSAGDVLQLFSYHV